MCGLGGYAGVDSKAVATLVRSLGDELDARGGHAAGYVTDRHWATRVGYWTDARGKFHRRASEGTVGIIHTRFATCGTGAQSEAHPFEIRRDGKPVLYGAHNGMIDDAAASARKHKRPFTVDSRELLELIADGDFDAIAKLRGYGVAAWHVPGDPAIHIVRLTECGEMHVVSIEGGGYAWASTWEILRDALLDAGLTAVHSYPLDAGVVYRITPTGIYKTEVRCALASRMKWTDWRSWGLGDDELDVIIDAQADDLFDLDGRDPTSTTSDDVDEWDVPTGSNWDKWMNVGRHGS